MSGVARYEGWKGVVGFNDIAEAAESVLARESLSFSSSLCLTYVVV